MFTKIDPPVKETRDGVAARRGRASATRVAGGRGEADRRGKAREESPAGGAELKGHTPISGTTVHGKTACLIGLPFLAMGVFVALMASGLIPSKNAPRNGEGPVGALAGGVFALVGAWMIVHGVLGLAAGRRARRMRERFPDAPWRADHPWDERGAKDMQRRGVGQMLFGMIFMIVFAAPFNMVAFFSAREGSALGYAFGCVNVFVALYGVAFVYRLIRLVKYGSGRIAFRRFPYHLGETAEFDYIPARRLEGVRKLVCTLRCIRETFVTTQVNGKTQTRIVSTVLHHQTRQIAGEQVGASHDGRVPLSFDLPPEAESTRLLDRPPVYWQLQISAETPGVNLDSRFLVPVYARPGPAGEPTRSRGEALREVAGIISFKATGDR